MYYLTSCEKITFIDAIVCTWEIGNACRVSWWMEEEKNEQRT